MSIILILRRLDAEPPAIRRGNYSNIGWITYTGGYVRPGDSVSAGQTALATELEQAAIEQSAAWYQNKDHLGLDVYWGYHSSYNKYSQVDLLPSVRAVLQKYIRHSI